MRNSELLRRLEVELCRPTVLVRDGVALSYRDRETTTDVYFQWVLILVDLGYLTSCADLRPVQRIWRDLCRLDVLVALGSMAECLSLVINRTRRGFKAHCATISPHLFPLIREDYDAVMSSNVWAAKRLIQLFSFTSRLSLQDIDMTQQLEAEFLEVEENITFEELPILSEMEDFIVRWIGPRYGEEFFPRHGPGGISESGRCSLKEKYSLLGTDERLRYSFRDQWWVDEPRSFERTARVVFVAKSYKTQRVISMEPCTLQYFQQGVWRALDSLIMKNPFLRDRLDFHDQARNRSLAQLGAIDRSYATIDLSAASDSVSYALVKRLFRRTWLMRYLFSTRSTHTRLPSGRIVELKKFAPMGSALCFPIETLVFASICAAVAKRSRSPLDFSVYGDDIIVPTSISEAVIEALTSLGFRVNSQKSYWSPSHWYRESCGAEYCDGFDVTPMRVSRKYAHKDMNVRFQKWVDSANSARLHMLPLLRQFYLTKLRKHNVTPLFSPTSVEADNYTNYQAAQRWSSDLQRVEVFVHQVVVDKTSRRTEGEDESTRLRHWLESTAQRDILFEPFVSNIMETTTSYRKVWVPHPSPVNDYTQGLMSDSAWQYIAATCPGEGLEE